MRRIDARPRGAVAIRGIAGGPAPLTPRDISGPKKAGRGAVTHAGGAA